LDGYARRVVVIVDSEAKARMHIDALIASGGLAHSDVLLFATSLEEANATDEELTALTIALAGEHGHSLAITAEQVRRFHDGRTRSARERSVEVPGLASSLQQLVSKASDGRWHLRKRDLVERLAVLIAEEMRTLPRDGWWRPVTLFVANRIVPPLNRPFPVGPS